MIAIKLFVVSVYILQFLVGKIFGILLVSLLLYFIASSIGLAQPYSAYELIFWLSDLPEGYKTTAFSSLLTIFGFLIAFSIGSSQQKQQFISQMKIEVASDIEDFFNEVSRKATDAEIYAKYLLKAAATIQDDTDQNSIDFHMYNVINETNAFLKTREILTAKSIEVHRFKGRYSIILASTWGATEQLNKAIEAFINITDNMWFPTPLINPDTPNKSTIFMRHIDAEKCQNYIDAYKNSYFVINGTTGGLRGRLITPITGMNLPFILAFLKLK